MPLLELAVAEDPRCPRNAFYHARELTFYTRWQEAIDALNKYLAMPEANWVNERCYAMRLLGKSHENLKNWGEAYKWYRYACAEAPNTREPWVELATLAYQFSNWEECHYAATQALAIKDKALVYTMDPSVWGSKPHDLLAISAYNLGNYEQAIEHGQIAVELDPDNTRLTNNLEYYRAKHGTVSA